MNLFATQHWVASLGQLRERGVSERTLRRAVGRGLVERVCSGVYHVTSAPYGFEARAMSLLLQTPIGSYLSGHTAGRLYGLRAMPEAPVELTTLIAAEPRVPPWARIATCGFSVPSRDVRQHPAGFAISSPLRTLFRLAAVFNQHRFERAAEDMWHRRLVTPSEAADYLQVVRRSGRNGVRRFEAWLEKAQLISEPAQSGMELYLLDRLARAGLPEPTRQHPVQLADGRVVRIDLAWPGIRLGLEPGHSWWHGGDRRQRADQARDRACEEVGWRILRYDEASVRERGVVQQVERIYRRRSAEVGHSTWTPPAA